MPSADDKVVLSLKIEIADAKKEIKAISGQLRDIHRAEGRAKTDETRDLRSRQRAAETDHKLKLRRLKELEASRKREARESKEATGEIKKQSIWLRDLTKIPEHFQEKYSAWAKRNPKLAAAGRGVGTAGKLFGRPAAAAARMGVGVAGSAVSGLLGMLIGGIQQGYQTHLQVGAAMAPLAGMGSRPGQIGIGKGIGMGHAPSQTYRHAAGVGRATGDPGAVTLAQQFAMGGGGMDVGEATGIMGSLRQAGVGFAGKENQTSAAKLLGQMVQGGIITGLEKARLPEYLKGVATMAEAMGGRQTGKVDVGSIANTLSYLGRIPGMQGQRGVNLMQTLDQSIRSPGGGEAGQQVMLQAFGFGKPGGETSYYDAMKRQQRGAQGAGGAQNIMDVFKELYSQYGVVGGGGSTQQQQEANLAINTAMPGLNLDMIEGIGDMINNGENQEEILKKIAEATKAFKPIEDRVVDAIKEGFSGVAKRIAGQEAKSAKIGAESAKLVESLQDETHKLLKELLELLKPHMKDIIAAIKYMGEFARESLKAGVQGGVKYTTEALKALVQGKGLGGVLEAVGNVYGERQRAQDVQKLKGQYPDKPPSVLHKIAEIRREGGLPMGGITGSFTGLSKDQIQALIREKEAAGIPLTDEQQRELVRFKGGNAPIRTHGEVTVPAEETLSPQGAKKLRAAARKAAKEAERVRRKTKSLKSDDDPYTGSSAPERKPLSLADPDTEPANDDDVIIKIRGRGAKSQVTVYGSPGDGITRTG